jgi:hypothetical protein
MANTVEAHDSFALIFKANSKIFEKEYGKVIFHCDMRRLTMGNFFLAYLTIE